MAVPRTSRSTSTINKKQPQYSEFYMDALLSAEHELIDANNKPVDIIDVEFNDGTDSIHDRSTSASIMSNTGCTVHQQDSTDSNNTTDHMSNSSDELISPIDNNYKSPIKKPRRLRNTHKSIELIASSLHTTPDSVTDTSMIEAAEFADVPATTAKPDRAPRRRKQPVNDNVNHDVDIGKPVRANRKQFGPENTRWYAIPELKHAGNELAKTGMKIGFPCLHTGMLYKYST